MCHVAIILESGDWLVVTTTHRHGHLAQDVLGDSKILLHHLLVELIQRSIHQLHADPHVTLATDDRANQICVCVCFEEVWE